MPHVSAGKVVSLNWSSIVPNTSSVKEGIGRIDDF